MRAVGASRYAFRHALHERLVLEQAAAAAFPLDPLFDLTLEFRRLFQDEPPIDFTVYSARVPRGA